MPGLRDILLLLLTVVAVYLAILLVRLTRAGRRHAPPAEAPTKPGEPDEPSEPAIMLPTLEWKEVKNPLGEAATDATLPIGESSSAALSSHGGFGEALADHLARADMETELQRMRAEMERMRKEMEDLRAARRVSPQYAEAMELAQRGCSAQDVADRLGISLAEAELVQALSRARQNFEEGEEYGGDGGVGGFDPYDGGSAR